MKKIISLFLFLIFVSGILLLSVRGLPGNPTENQISELRWRDDGPFELSPERGRFALMYSVIKDNSVFFSIPMARFAAPDVGFRDDKYVSLFAPALSFIIIPGYLIGEKLGNSQFGTYLVIAIFALINAVLIRKISLKLGANEIASRIAALTFLFATPAFTYAVNLYQHHITTFLILLSVYLLISFESFWALLLVFFAFAIGVPLDYPNFFLMLPIMFAASGKVFNLINEKNLFKIRIKYWNVFASFIMILPLIFFLWFNTAAYGGPLHFLGGSAVTAVKSINSEGFPENVAIAERSSGLQDQESMGGLSLFKTRNLLNGFYIHFFSPDRGILTFTPVILLGVIGFVLAYNKKEPVLKLILGIIGMNILLYSMWGDPWGGWAFGSRYLIPSYAMLSIGIALALTTFRKKLIFLLVFLVLVLYSIAVNTLGALTSSTNPPQQEVLSLEKQSGLQQRYSYDRNIEFLQKSGSKSFFYQSFFKKYFNAISYYLIISGSLISVTIAMVIWLYFSGKKKGKNYA